VARCGAVESCSTASANAASARAVDEERPTEASDPHTLRAPSPVSGLRSDMLEIEFIEHQVAGFQLLVMTVMQY